MATTTTISGAASSGSLVLFYWLGILLRLWWMDGGGGGSALWWRVEVSTPVSAWPRLREGLALLKAGRDPYEGVLFHETPLVLHTFQLIDQVFSAARIRTLFLFFDCLTAWLLGRAAALAARRWIEVQDKQDVHAEAKELLLTDSDAESMSRWSQLAYLFHPFLVANCAAQTTTVLANLVTACFLLSALSRRYSLAAVSLAVLTYQSCYTIILIVPLCFFISEDVVLRRRSDCAPAAAPGGCGRDAARGSTAVAKTLLVFGAQATLLMAASRWIMGSWAFVHATHGFVLTVPELTPNTGLFWYFFTEMFEHFRAFFVAVFQLNVFVYVIPLGVRLRREPLLLAVTLIALIAVFKSYPGFGDVGFYMATLPMLKHLLPFTKQIFIVSVMFVATTVLGPILYHLWIYNGSANANYYFAINLVFGTAQIFLITDLLFAHVKREFYVAHGFRLLRPSATAAEKNVPKLVLQ